RKHRREITPRSLHPIHRALKRVLHVIRRAVKLLRHARSKSVKRLISTQRPVSNIPTNLRTRLAHLRTNKLGSIHTTLTELHQVLTGNLPSRRNLRHDERDLRNLLIIATSRSDRVLHRIQIRDNLLRLNTEREHLLLSRNKRRLRKRAVTRELVKLVHLRIRRRRRSQKSRQRRT